MYDYRLFFSNPPSDDEAARRMPHARDERVRIHRLPSREPRERRPRR
jgi:hypothetical protein